MPGGRLDRRGAEPNALRKPAMVAEVWAVRKISSRREALKSRKETLGSVGCGGRPRWGAKEDEAAFIMSFFGLAMGGRGEGCVWRSRVGLWRRGCFVRRRGTVARRERYGGQE